jgi:hypothetical protein
MEYIVIRSAFNQTINADTDSEALERAKAICTKPKDNVFVVKYKDIIRK